MVMGLESDIEDLETAGAARLNLIIRNEALEAGNSLKDRFGTPFVYGAPYGYQGTIDWLKRDFRAVIGEPINEELLARIEEKQADLMPMGGGPMASMEEEARHRPLFKLITIHYLDCPVQCESLTLN